MKIRHGNNISSSMWLGIYKPKNLKNRFELKRPYSIKIAGGTEVTLTTGVAVTTNTRELSQWREPSK